jgi:hypothetical protein
MDIAALTRDATLWALFVDAVQELEEEKRAELVGALGFLGIGKITSDYGTATFTPGKPAAVANERELLPWVLQHRPDMIVNRVNPAYIAALKSECERFGVASDPETGEAIPGVKMAAQGPALRIVKNPEARQNARETIRRLAEQSLRELEGDTP